MMNVRNFYLKSTFLSFNSETLHNQHCKQVIKNSNQKSNRSFFKPSQRVDMLMKNFKLASKASSTKESIPKNEANVTHFDFQPPSLQSRRNKTLNNISSTLSPRKSTQYPSSYQLYKTDFKESSHRRRFSENSFLKSRNKKGLIRIKQAFANPETSKIVNIDFQVHQGFGQPRINQKNLKGEGFCKSSNKIKLFEINNYFDQNQQVVHSSKNSSFITTLPTKRKSFITAKSISLKSHDSKKNLSPDKKKQQTSQIESKISSSIQQKSEDIKKSIQTTGSAPTRKIEHDKADFKPISKDFFPQSSNWQKDEDFNKHSQSKQRIYRIKEKESLHKTGTKPPKDNMCRPWSSEKRQTNRIQFEDQLQFLCIKQDCNFES